MTTAFEKRCRKVAEDMDIGIDFYDDDSKAGAHEDDGTLHVVWRGKRACFDVSNCQDDAPSVQNGKTRQVLKSLGLEKWIGEDVLVDEDDEDDEEQGCPHCGRGW